MEFSKHKNYRNLTYLNWLREQKCVVSGKPAQCAHHVRLGTNGGAGIKPSDYFCLPLRNEYHTTGPFALHLMGEESFFSQFKINFEKRVFDYLKQFLLDEYGLKYKVSHPSLKDAIWNLVSDIELRRPAEESFRSDLVVPKLSETDFYLRAKEYKNKKNKELRESLKSQKLSGLNTPSLYSDNEFYQKTRELKKEFDRKNREKNKKILSDWRKEQYKKSQRFKKELNKNP